MHQSTSIDFLIRIKNGYVAGKKSITAPISKFSTAIASLLKRYGYIADFKVSKENQRDMLIDLIYDNNQPKISQIELFSKPGRRIYSNNSSLPWGKTPKSLIIISTSSGVISQKEAKVKGIGGEIIAEVW